MTTRNKTKFISHDKYSGVCLMFSTTYILFFFFFVLGNCRYRSVLPEKKTKNGWQEPKIYSHRDWSISPDHDRFFIRPQSRLWSRLSPQSSATDDCELYHYLNNSLVYTSPGLHIQCSKVRILNSDLSFSYTGCQTRHDYQVRRDI